MQPHALMQVTAELTCDEQLRRGVEVQRRGAEISRLSNKHAVRWRGVTPFW